MAYGDITDADEIEWDYECPWIFELDQHDESRKYLYTYVCRMGDLCPYRFYRANLKLPFHERDHTIKKPEPTKKRV